MYTVNASLKVCLKFGKEAKKVFCVVNKISGSDIDYIVLNVWQLTSSCFYFFFLSISSLKR